MTSPSSRPAATRSLIANALVGGLVALAAGVPLLSNWAHDREEQRLGALLDDGHFAEATVDGWTRNRFGGTEHCHYIFRANGIRYSSSVNIPGRGGTCCCHVRFLPIIYDPADAGNHIVGQSLTHSEVANRLSIYPKIANAGWLFAALALLAEFLVRGQLALARGGAFAIGTVTRLDPAMNGSPLLATYEFITPAGEPL